ncbi:MAG: outer membrane lipoprotein-sorting protein [Epsilonproteobacteria bacterium]|nr:MAG: outer membrane lipoprotein-sorting protein [Campylobacterota bacterium]
MTHLTTKKISGAVLTAALLTTVASAGVSNNLAYPSGKLKNATQVMDNVYFVNHFYAFKNYAIEKKGRTITVIVKKSEGKKPLTLTVERYINNDYSSDPKIKSKDLAIFRSGQLRGNGMLITDYKDDAKSQEYLLWLPALRKIRRFAQPAHDDAWGGTDFTFGDVTLRKPSHEKHTLMGTQKFGKKVQSMVIPKAEQTSATKKLPGGTNAFSGRQVYKVKSTTKFSGWWYDHRITYVDTKTFADYRTEYYKGGKMIKFLDKNWPKMSGSSDPRALRWYTWYAKDLRNNHETLAYIPKKVTAKNKSTYKIGKKKYDTANLWQESTLTKIKR